MYTHVYVLTYNTILDTIYIHIKKRIHTCSTPWDLYITINFLNNAQRLI